MTTTTQSPQPKRLDYAKASPGGFRAMLGLEAHIGQSTIETGLLDLIKLRASQINGCAYCIDMHTKEAAARGESGQRLHSLVAWRETSFYTKRERAALEWTEALTLIHQQPVADELFDGLSSVFSFEELADLAIAVVAINGWNRLAIAFREVPGSYQGPVS